MTGSNNTPKSIWSADQHNTNPEMTDEERAFDFFGLPRELRDEIYSMLVTDIDLTGRCERPKVEVRVSSAPLPKLLTLSRQFTTEYEERIRCDQSLTIRDCCIVIPDSDLNPGVKRVSKAEIHVQACCASSGYNHLSQCGMIGDLSRHLNRMTPTLENMEYLDHLKISVHLCSVVPGASESAQFATRTLEMVGFTKMPGIECIQVYSLPRSSGLHWRECYERSALMATWKVNDGWECERRQA